MKTKYYSTGEEESLNKEERDNMWIYGLTFTLLIGFFGTIAITDLLTNGYISANYLTKDDCNFQIPPKYEILTNDKTYKIREKIGDSYFYLSGTKNDITTSSINSVKFKSECKARAYLKRYLQKSNNAYGYKVLEEEKPESVSERYVLHNGKYIKYNGKFIIIN